MAKVTIFYYNQNKFTKKHIFCLKNYYCYLIVSVGKNNRIAIFLNIGVIIVTTRAE